MLWFPLLLTAIGASFGQVRWVDHPLPVSAEIRGAAPGPRDPSGAWLWGDGVFQAGLRTGNVTRVAQGDFGEPGCAFQGGLALLSRPEQLVWLRGPRLARRTIIDTEADFSGCLDLTLFGRKGLLITNRGLQVRFYEPASTEPGGMVGSPRWPYREIYSFYTASYQSGLIHADVDSDGVADLFSGNYWIQAPEMFDRPWRLFAINTYNEEPQSAHLRLALIRRVGRSKPSLLVAQGEMHPARLAVFDAPADVKQLWTETRLDGDLALDHPRTLAVADFDRDGREDFLLAESEGAARIWWWRQLADGSFAPSPIARGTPILTGWAADADRDGRPDIVLVERRRIRWLGNQPLE
ncbi:MAG: VCBS repeat-containing protein [Bryobacterales bacterium]|nr:VCBS repeat-containing protein [Bryobacterales bacterium]